MAGKLINIGYDNKILPPQRFKIIGTYGENLIVHVGWTTIRNIPKRIPLIVTAKTLETVDTSDSINLYSFLKFCPYTELDPDAKLDEDETGSLALDL